MNSLNDNDHKNLTDIGDMYNTNYINKVLFETAEGNYEKLNKMKTDHQKTLKKFVKVYKTGGAWRDIFGTVASTAVAPLGTAAEFIIPFLFNMLPEDQKIDEGLVQLLAKMSALFIRSAPTIMLAIGIDPKTKRPHIKDYEKIKSVLDELNYMLIKYKGAIKIPPPIPQALLAQRQEAYIAALAPEQQAYLVSLTPEQQQAYLAQLQAVPVGTPPSAQPGAPPRMSFLTPQRGGEISECSFSMDLTNLSETSYQKGGNPANFSREINLTDSAFDLEKILGKHDIQKGSNKLDTENYTLSEFSLADILGSKNTQQKRSNNNIDTSDKSGSENYALSEFSLADILGSKNTQQKRSNNTINLTHLLRGGDDTDIGESLEDILAKIDATMNKQK